MSALDTQAREIASTLNETAHEALRRLAAGKRAYLSRDEDRYLRAAKCIRSATNASGVRPTDLGYAVARILAESDAARQPEGK